MSAYDDFCEIAADAALEVATEMGLTADILGLGETTEVTVYVLPVDATLDASHHQGPTDGFHLTLAIPRQTNFPLSDFTGATVEYESVVYGVESVDTGGIPLELTPIVTLHCMRYGEDAEIGN